MTTGIEHSLKAALEHAGATHDLYDDVAPAIAAGRAQYWHNDGAAIVTEVLTFPRVKVLNYWLIGGALPAALELAPEIETWARKVGCTRATGIGRPGWKQIVQQCGFRVGGIAFRKELIA